MSGPFPTSTAYEVGTPHAGFDPLTPLALKLMKLLVPVDGSDSALTALDKLSMIVHLFRDKPQVVLINVQLPFPHPRAIASLGKEVMVQYYGYKVMRRWRKPENASSNAGILSRSRST